MKKYGKWLLIVSVLFVSFTMLPDVSHAQPGNPGDDPDAPIDGGVSLLIAAGVGYGVKKVRDNRKKKTEELL